jgi:hypothetical protein
MPYFHHVNNQLVHVSLVTLINLTNIYLAIYFENFRVLQTCYSKLVLFRVRGKFPIVLIVMLFQCCLTGSCHLLYTGIDSNFGGSGSKQQSLNLEITLKRHSFTYRQ